MEIRDYIRILGHNWILLTCLTLLGVLGAVGASIFTKASYTAETQLFVAIQSSGSATDLQLGNSFSQARVQSYVMTVGTPAVMQPVIEQLGLTESPKELAAKVKATAEDNTVIITIQVTDGSAAQSAAIAQAVADSLIKAVDNLEKSDVGGTSPVKLSIVTPPSVPEAPSHPNPKLNILVGLVAGLLLGLGATVLRTALDNKVRDESHLRKITAAPLLGSISFDRDAAKRPLVSQVAPQSPRAESFRQLRTNMQFASISRKSGAIMVTSSLPSEGKTTTATNIAITFSQAGQRVVLIDADLRRPTVGEYMGLDRNAGLTTALLGRAGVDDLLQKWGEDELYVLTSGQIPPNPSELLASDEMLQLVRHLELKFDVVIIDAPPLLPVTDAAVLSQHVDGVVLVVNSQNTRQAQVERSLASLELVNASVLGVILNMLPFKGVDSYAYSYHNLENESPARPAGSASRDARPATVPGQAAAATEDDHGRHALPAGRR
ncbi:chromosome partitioning protein [Arthrobacter sp. SW1]|uniref:polysaccharide biosynthesis tyrosine autokinase n=1 Tax=Arthrobacter sp. SW1 TaxID=1920889 RepID=UPI000877BBC9|nr:polysaccharide biosynthesis tyrosine autokinase [Arthrobacter sp. SW1]OFI37293.1 chromosome partitioning protein [Arthrobacter sp. SW1]